MKKTISLDGNWKIAGVDNNINWANKEDVLPEDAITLEGQVPGEVHTALFAAAMIPDPFYGKNADEVQWIENKKWWYKTTFNVDEVAGKRTVLRFGGLDTYATIYLNGKEIGKTDNMFISHSFDVTNDISLGENIIAVQFDAAAEVLDELDSEGLFGCFNTPRVNARKMQCGFGWDWTHRFVGAGVWRSVELISYDAVNISDIHIEPEIDSNIADVWINIKVDNNTEKNQQVTAYVVIEREDDQEKVEIVGEIPPEGGVIEGVIRIHEPELWYPNGMGEPALYKCMVGLSTEDGVADVAEKPFGIRNIAIIERDEEIGNRFTVMINGVETFCKGGNWVPADHFVSRITPEKYRELVKLAKDANFTMLRVWGGGIYEDEAFYNACDEMGIMVWQDFMFACATYPDNEKFNKNVEREVRETIMTLRHHPSIVIWSGNNECEMNMCPTDNWSGKKIFHEIIPKALKELDHTRPYRPCCPYGGSPANTPEEGDSHTGGWYSLYYANAEDWKNIIENEETLFASEFPNQGSPQIESLREFIPESEIYPLTNDIYEYKNKDNPHSGRTDGVTHQKMLVGITNKLIGGVDSAESFAAYGGIAQGETMKAQIEHFRREKWKISGCLFWMYNDCWPAIGWSIVDYYTRPKASYYYVRRAFVPIIISFKEIGDKVILYVTSDDPTKDINGKLSIGVLSLETSKYAVQEMDIKVKANTSQPIWESIAVSEILADPARQCLVAMLTVDGETIAKNVYFSNIPKEMVFPQPKLLVERKQLDENTHQMTIGAEAYVRNLVIGNIPAKARPSDNFFDLLPGERYTVTIENLTVEDANNLKINLWA